MVSRQGVLQGLHTLVVEDDRDAREILTSVLGYFGALVTVARTAKEGLTLLHEVKPDVVVTDMLLGPSDGLTLLADARKQRNHAPFIAVSGADFDARHLARAGFAAYLRKPIDHIKLVDAILAVVRPR
jgi:CheY-like chemotaxis protein